MYQKDYILRMIEMVGQLIAAILGKIRKGEYDTAYRQLSNLYYDVLKEDAAYFRNIPENELTTSLLKNHNYTNGHLEILAELFSAEAELSIAENKNTSAITFLRKSLIIFEFIDSEQKIYSLERINKMEALRRKLELLRN